MSWVPVSFWDTEPESPPYLAGSALWFDPHMVEELRPASM